MILAVPSWVIPGTYAENLTFLRDKDAISAVELLFFLYDPSVHAELERDFPVIVSLKGRFCYSAHLPSPLRCDHRPLIDRLSPLVSRFIVHPEGDPGRLAELLNPWIAEVPAEFCLENTQGDLFETCLPLLPGATICMDTGHLLIQGRSPAAFARDYGTRIRHIHLHTTLLGDGKEGSDGRLRDHRPLRPREPWLRDLRDEIQGFSGTLELELFSFQEIETSIAILTQEGLIP